MIYRVIETVPVEYVYIVKAQNKDDALAQVRETATINARHKFTNWEKADYFIEHTVIEE